MTSTTASRAFIGDALEARGFDSLTARAVGFAAGKRIAGLTVIPDGNDGDGSLRVDFDDGTHLSLHDSGRDCCENRYMNTDDDLTHYIGAELLDVEVREGPSTGGRGEDSHEQMFLVVTTSRGAFTCVTHNEHNGYYGGFSLRCRTSEEQT